MQQQKKYVGYGYHGGGRPPKIEGEKRVCFQVSCTKQEREKIKEIAERENKTVSRLLIDNTLAKETEVKDDIE